MTRRNYSTCGNPDCQNPDNGKLKKKNYRRRTLQTGEVKIYPQCRHCYNAHQKAQKAKPRAQGHGDMTALQVANCPLDVKLAQAFILGRVA